MSPEDIRKLLGGYATGTLTDAERNLLFTAALEDQALFDALADEEALRALLSDSAVRGELLAVIDEKSDASQREAWREAEPAATRVQPSPVQAAAMPPLPPDATASGAWTLNGPWVSPWPKGIALAGTLVIAIVIIAFVSFQKNRSAAPVELAKNEQPVPAPPRQATPPTQAPPAPVPQPAIDAQRAPSGAVNETRSIQAAPPAGRLDAPAAVTPSSAQITAGASASQQPALQTPAPPPPPANPAAADERQRSAESGANAVKEEKDQQATVAAEARSVQPARIEPAPSAPSPAARKTEQPDKVSKAKAAPVQGFAAGALSKSRFAEPRFIATITDINGTIVSIGAGTNAGLKNADTLEIVRGEVLLGTVKLTDTRPTFAVGSLTRSLGADPPRPGDSVRLQAPPAR